MSLKSLDILGGSGTQEQKNGSNVIEVDFTSDNESFEDKGNAA